MEIHHSPQIDESDDTLLDKKQARKESYCPLTDSQIDWALFNRNQNGLAPAVRKIGRRVYLVRSKWRQWLLTGSCE